METICNLVGFHKNENMKQLLALLLCSLMFTAANAQSKDEAAVAKAVETLRKSMVDANKAGLEKVTLPSLSYGHSNGRIEDRATFIGNLLTGYTDFVTMDLTAQTIAITGGTAVVRHTLTGDTNDSGKPGHVQLYVLLIWQKNGGEWKLLARQAVKVPPTPSH